MTFDEKREQILLAAEIGRLLDSEGSEEERRVLMEKIGRLPEDEDLLRTMVGDDILLQQAVPAAVPDESMDRFQAVIDREFSEPGLSSAPAKRAFRPGPLMQIAAALVLVTGTFLYTVHLMQIRMDDAIGALAAHMEAERTLLARTVQDALETQMSGDPVQIAHHGNWSEVLTPIKTYKSTSGHWCRQYLRVTTVAGLDMSVVGTACRDQGGTWNTVSAEPLPQTSSGVPSGT